MSMFASRVTKVIPIPFDPPHEATIQKLSGRQIDRAVKAFQAQMYKDIAEVGGAAVIKEAQALYEKVKDGAADTPKRPTDPLAGYDKHALVEAGLKSWTIPDAPITHDTVEDMGSDEIAYFATEILRLTKPSLFQTIDEAEAAQKNA
jgi:hypothetical protein